MNDQRRPEERGKEQKEERTMQHLRKKPVIKHEHERSIMDQCGVV